MKSAPNSLVSSDLASHCRISGQSAADRRRHRRATGAVENAIARELLQLTPTKRLGLSSRRKHDLEDAAEDANRAEWNQAAMSSPSRPCL